MVRNGQVSYLTTLFLTKKWLDLVKVVSLSASAITQVTQCFKILSHDFSNVVLILPELDARSPF